MKTIFTRVILDYSDHPFELNSNAMKWCRSTFGPGSSTRAKGQHPYNWWHVENGGLTKWYFRSPEHATMFTLRWGGTVIEAWSTI